MKRFVAFAVVGFVLTTVGGCGSKAENLLKDLIRYTNALAEAVEKKESADRIKAAGQRVKDTFQQLQDLNVPKEEKEKLEAKYKAEAQAAGERLTKALEANPEARTSLKELGPLK
jgi:hypothetical protein